MLLLFHHPYFQWYLESDCVCGPFGTRLLYSTLLPFKYPSYNFYLWKLNESFWDSYFLCLCGGTVSHGTCPFLSYNKILALYSKQAFFQVYISVVNIFLQISQKAVRVQSTAKLKDNYDQHFHCLIFYTMYFISLGIYSHRDQWIRKHWAHFLTTKKSKHILCPFIISMVI